MKKLTKQNGNKIFAVVLSAIVIIGYFNFVSRTEKKAKADNIVNINLDEIEGANLFNVKNIKFEDKKGITIKVDEKIYSNTFTIEKDKEYQQNVVAIGTNNTLNEICDNLLINGNTYILNFDTNGETKIYIINTNTYINTKEPFNATNDIINSKIWFWGSNETNLTQIENITLTQGTTIYPYQPNYKNIYNNGYNNGYNDGQTNVIKNGFFSYYITESDFQQRINQYPAQAAKVVDAYNTNETEISKIINEDRETNVNTYYAFIYNFNKYFYTDQKLKVTITHYGQGLSNYILAYIETNKIKNYNSIFEYKVDIYNTTTDGKYTTAEIEINLPNMENYSLVLIPNIKSLWGGFTTTILFNNNINNLDETTTNAIYESGYNKGIEDTKKEQTTIQNEAYNNGYNKGYTNGKNAGYSQGKIDGAKNANDYSFLGLFTAVIDAPIQVLLSVFQIGTNAENDFFGINLANLIQMLFTLMVIILIVKFVMSR